LSEHANKKEYYIEPAAKEWRDEVR
jgi:hypothetical protein